MTVLLVQAAATLFMTGLIWFVQVVHYPLFAGVGGDFFIAYAGDHARLTAWVVAPPMLVEAAAALALLKWRPSGVSPALALAGVAVLALIWASTWLLQVPQHRILAGGYDAAAHGLLVAGNWIRAVGWSARALLALTMIARVMGRTRMEST